MNWISGVGMGFALCILLGAWRRQERRRVAREALGRWVFGERKGTT
jgi:hypothetical protein